MMRRLNTVVGRTWGVRAVGTREGTGCSWRDSGRSRSKRHGWQLSVKAIRNQGAQNSSSSSIRSRGKGMQGRLVGEGGQEEVLLLGGAMWQGIGCQLLGLVAVAVAGGKLLEMLQLLVRAVCGLRPTPLLCHCWCSSYNLQSRGIYSRYMLNWRPHSSSFNNSSSSSSNNNSSSSSYSRTRSWLVVAQEVVQVLQGFSWFRVLCQVLRGCCSQC
jgi:hypothetical protein